jgi:hypothetical protein
VVQEQVAALPPTLPVRVMFEDEARFGRISDPRRCGAPAGGRPEVHPQVVREYEYAFAAVSPQDGALDTLVLPWANTEAMGVFFLGRSVTTASQRVPPQGARRGGLAAGQALTGTSQ